MFSGSLVRRGCKVLIAAAAASSFRDQEAVAGLSEIVQQLAGVNIIDHRPNGHWQFDGLTFSSTAIAAFTMPSAFGRVFGIKTEMQECVVVRTGGHDDVASTAAVAAAGSTARHEFLAPEGQAAVAAIPGFHADSDFIDEHVGTSGWELEDLR